MDTYHFPDISKKVAVAMNDELYQRFLAEIHSLVAALKSFKTFVDSVDEAEVEKGTPEQMEAIKNAMDSLHDGLDRL